MGYLRFPPPEEQRAYVEHFWLVSGSSTRREILIPNGRPALVVALGELGTRHDPLTGSVDPNGDVLFGITTRPFVLAQSGCADYVGVQLKPWGVAALHPQARLVDEFLPLSGWLGKPALEDLKRSLGGTEFGAARADRLARFLNDLLRPLPEAVLAQLDNAVAAVEQAHGRITVDEIVRRLRVSYSTVYRLFAAYLGVAPKTFCEIVRYYHFVGGLTRGNPDGQALLAALHGYYDQAHAARDFKRFTGVSASMFRQLHDGIAVLMHS